MIVVTTPTGNIGRHVVQQLVEAGEAVRVVARDPSKLPEAVRDRVEVVSGSHGDAGILDQAFRAAQAVFWLCPPTPSATPEAQTVQFSRAAAAAIKRYRVPRVVAATTLGRDTAWQDRAGMATASIRMVDLLRETGASVRGLALPAFMDNALQQIAMIREGRMVGAIGAERKLPHTATRDTGTVAAQLLRDASWQGQEDVPVLGPEELSYADIAAIVSEVAGREVRYEQISFDDLEARLRARGMADPFVRAYLAMLRAKDEGMDNVASRATAVIGSTKFRDWAEAELKPALISGLTTGRL